MKKNKQTYLQNNKITNNVKPLIFNSDIKYLISTVSNEFLNKVINKLILLRDNKINKVLFKNLNKKEQFLVYTICGRLGLYYTSFNNKWSGIVSPLIIRSFNPVKKEILIHLIHTPKCGGMSIKHNLKSLNENKILQYFPKHFTIQSSHGYIIKIVNGHVPARNYSNNAIRIGFTRNPNARFNSAFTYIINGSINRDHVILNEFKKYINILEKYKTPNQLLQNKKIMNRLISNENGIIHFFPLEYWLCDNNRNLLIDYCIRQEHLQNDWTILCNILGIQKFIKLEQINISKKKKKNNYKQ